MIKPTLVVLVVGTSSDREVSIGSGKACAQALSCSFATRMIEISADTLPEELDPARHVVFSTLHGTFGEDGGMPRLLDKAGVYYAGCGAHSSELTMNKTRTKALAATHGVSGPREMYFWAKEKPTADRVIAELGEFLIVKPNAEGSSVGLRVIANRNDLEAALDEITRGDWLIEERIIGREVSVGVLNGRAMGVVEIRPKSGVYDYKSKYTKGHTEYFAPAPLEDNLTEKVQSAAEVVFAVCGCRDYARVDFMVSASNELYLLEINTLPGMKETSLLPMSARCVGLDFTALVSELVTPALQRLGSGRALTKT